jgi:predicted RNase H-like HicB family nuclease
VKLLKNKLVFTEEDGTWTAHDPAVEGVYGIGPTRKAAKADLREALELLGDHVASQAEEEAEDVSDETKAKIRARLAEIDAGRQKLVPLEDAMRERGLLPVRLGIISDIHGDIVALDAALARLRAMKCDQILCAGDLLDLEPFGEEVVQRIEGRGDRLHSRQPRAVGARTPSPAKNRLAQVCPVHRRGGRSVHRRHRAVARRPDLPGHPALFVVRRAGGCARGDVARAAGQ